MSDQELIPEGRYLARVSEAVLAWTGAHEPQIAVGFEITAPESHAGRLITYYGSLSTTKITKGKNEGKTVAELTMEALENIGWDGEGFGPESLAKCANAEASIVVAHDEDQKGNMRAKVRFVNSPNAGGAAVKERLNDQEAANVTKKFQGMLMKRKQQRDNQPVANRAPARGNPRPANAGDAYEDPSLDDLGF